jgi:Raf kinase inhibitor-like YbhB/YbcL family protein
MKRRPTVFVLALALLMGAAASAQSNLTVTSLVFQNGGPIPSKYTCDGDEKSPPPLAWSNLPAGARSVAVVVDDPDAPHGTFVHWVVFDLPAGTTSLDAATLPAGAEQGKNGKGQLGWTPPCPPSGVHHYRFRVYALGNTLTLSQPTEQDLVRAMRGNVIAQGELVGTYQRSKK